MTSTPPKKEGRDATLLDILLGGFGKNEMLHSGAAVRSVGLTVAVVGAVGFGCGSSMRVTIQPIRCEVRWGGVSLHLVIENRGGRTEPVSDPVYFREVRIFDTRIGRVIEDRTFTFQYDLIIHDTVYVAPGEKWEGDTGFSNDQLRTPGIYGIEWVVLDRYDSSSPRTSIEMASDAPGCRRE